MHTHTHTHPSMLPSKLPRLIVLPVVMTPLVAFRLQIALYPFPSPTTSKVWLAAKLSFQASITLKNCCNWQPSSLKFKAWVSRMESIPQPGKCQMIKTFIHKLFISCTDEHPKFIVSTSIPVNRTPSLPPPWKNCLPPICGRFYCQSSVPSSGKPKCLSRVCLHPLMEKMVL